MTEQMIRSIKASIVLLLFISIQNVQSACVMQGFCHQHNPTTFGPCVKSGDGFYEPLSYLNNSFAYDLNLQKYCGFLLEDNDPQLCCTPDQAQAMTKHLVQAAAVLGTCPSCFHNFAKMWCEFTCSPKQSNFVSLLTSKPITEKPVDFASGDETATHYADVVEYRMSRKYGEGTFKSCKDVTFGGSTALSVMCAVTPCLMENWFDFLGTQQLTMNIPLSTKFKLMEENESDDVQEPNYMLSKFSRCNESIGPEFSACSRMECNIEEFSQLVNLDDGRKSVEYCKINGIACLQIFVISVLISSVSILACVGIFINFSKDSIEEQESTSGRIKRTAVWIEQFMTRNARDIGELVGRRPNISLACGVFIISVSLTGMLYHKESNNVLDMWSSPLSRARMEETLFNTNFGRPQRYQQIMLLSKRNFTLDSINGPIFYDDIMLQFFDILNDIKNITTTDINGRIVTLDDVCYRPMGPGYDCLIMSPTNYFQGIKENVNTTRFVEEKELTGDVDDFEYKDSDAPQVPWLNHVRECIAQPLTQKTSVGLSCFGTYGGPSSPNLIFGKVNAKGSYLSSTAMMMTILVTQRTEAEIERAELWEAAFLEYCRNYKDTLDKVVFSFMGERSISDEVEKDAKEEILTIVIALLFLFGYVTFSLGRTFFCEDSLWSILVHTRFALGACSVAINLLSSFCSWGIFSMIAIHPVKNALVVQFFLVTLLGVCRTFMVVKYYAQMRVTEAYMGPRELPELVGKITAGTMPALVTSSLGCSFSFFIGSFTDLPAIKSFCLYAGLSVVIDVFLHVTLFLGIFVWDTRRELEGRAEFFIAFRLKNLQGAFNIGRQKATDTYMTQFFKNTLAPFMMRGVVRIITGIWFLCSILMAILLSSKVEVGFDQTMAFTETSYISTHLRYLDKFIDAGPPVFFTVHGELDWHDPEVQNKFCTFPECQDVSFGNIMTYSVQHTDETYLSGEVYNWIDSYLQWISRDSPCCKVYIHDPSTFCSTNRNKTAISDNACRSCMDYDYVANAYPVSSIKYKRPSIYVFYKHLKHFLEDTPNSECVFGGRASFKDAISFTSKGRIQSSYFMTFHKKLQLSNSSDFVEAMEKARMVARRLETAIDDTAHVFAISKIFPFYEQYGSILEVMITQLAFTAVGVFGIVGITLGIDIKGALCAVVCQISNYFHIVGVMFVFGIPVNAISATIIVMSSGMLIEFSVNILKGYAVSNKQHGKDRAEDTLATVGPIIFSGPVVTMSGSTLFLYGAHLKIINVYFCQLVMITILSSAIHALLFLPFLLSFGGSKSHRNRNVVMCIPPDGALHLVSPADDSCASDVENPSPINPRLGSQKDPLLDYVPDEEADLLFMEHVSPYSSLTSARSFHLRKTDDLPPTSMQEH